jgi:hypothetical protein
VVSDIRQWFFYIFTQCYRFFLLQGAHGLPAPFGTDPFFAQGAIKVSGNNVFTVNVSVITIFFRQCTHLVCSDQAGSNTATMFSIDANEPAKLKMVGQPVSTGGEFPVSVTISKQSGQVCVLNGGRVNGVKFVAAFCLSGCCPADFVFFRQLLQARPEARAHSNGQHTAFT